VIAVLAAVAVRFLVPVGWMPNAGAGAPVVICTAEGVRLADRPDLPVPGHTHPAHQEHCLFAGFALIGGHGLAAVPAPTVRLAPRPSRPLFDWAPSLQGEQHRPQYPRGPPQPV
jgi:hypothetical protein